MTLDESSLRKDQKAGSIRDLPFQKLELIDSQSKLCDEPARIEITKKAASK